MSDFSPNAQNVEPNESAQPTPQSPAPQSPYQAQPPATNVNLMDSGMPYPVAQPKNPISGLLVTAMVLGIVGFISFWIPVVNFLSILLGIVAIILGTVGLLQLKNNNKSGKGVGITGIVLGALAVILSIIVLVGFFNWVKDTPDFASAMNQAQSQGTSPNSEATTGKDEQQLKFGDTWKLPNDVEITITNPTKFTPSEYTEVPEGTTPMKCDVIITNNSDKVFDPTKSGLYSPDVQSGSENSEWIFDYDQKLKSWSASSVQPGKSLTFSVAFAIKDPSDISMQFGEIYYEGLDNYDTYSTAVFTN
ncbi:MAG: DUF4190 domain-containing protein [Varibaculum sp.]|nr:DUF4190 domain-containing protein [Varibaculum sp.]